MVAIPRHMVILVKKMNLLFKRFILLSHFLSNQYFPVCPGNASGSARPADDCADGSYGGVFVRQNPAAARKDTADSGENSDTVRPKASATPSKPIPTSGNAAANTALPHPPELTKKFQQILLHTFWLVLGDAEVQY